VLGIGQLAIFEALARGPVTVVVPLVGTHALWAVMFSIVLLRRFEAIGRRVVFAALLAVAGGILIGVFRTEADEDSTVYIPTPSIEITHAASVEPPTQPRD